jgi:hypothetical protein
MVQEMKEPNLHPMVIDRVNEILREEDAKVLIDIMKKYDINLSEIYIYRDVKDKNEYKKWGITFKYTFYVRKAIESGELEGMSVKIEGDKFCVEVRRNGWFAPFTWYIDLPKIDTQLSKDEEAEGQNVSKGKEKSNLLTMAQKTAIKQALVIVFSDLLSFYQSLETDVSQFRGKGRQFTEYSPKTYTKGSYVVQSTQSTNVDSDNVRAIKNKIMDLGKTLSMNKDAWINEIKEAKKIIFGDANKDITSEQEANKLYSYLYKRFVTA